MITYIAKETNDVDLIVYDDKYLTEDDLKFENRVSLLKPYVPEEKEGYKAILFIEKGELKCRYEKIEEASDLKNIQSEITQLEKATAEVFELIMGGKNEI